MKFHNQPDGNPARCESIPCGQNPHYLTGVEARIAYETLNNLPTFVRLTKEGVRLYALPNGKTVEVQPGQSVENLASDFADFLTSERADAPALDLGDWRSRQKEAATLNGDARADATPATSVSGYYDPYDYDDELPEEFRPF